MNFKKRKKDILLIGGLVIIGLIIGLILLLSRKTGMTVQVRVSGEVVQTFPIDEDAEYEIIGKNDGKNLLIIKDGSAWIEEADCPDKLCKNMGKISLVGQSVVCLPHEAVVEIVDADGQKTDDGVDIIVE